MSKYYYGPPSTSPAQSSGSSSERKDEAVKTINTSKIEELLKRLGISGVDANQKELASIKIVQKLVDAIEDIPHLILMQTCFKELGMLDRIQYLFDLFKNLSGQSIRAGMGNNSGLSPEVLNLLLELQKKQTSEYRDPRDAYYRGVYDPRYGPPTRTDSTADLNKRIAEAVMSLQNQKTSEDIRRKEELKLNYERDKIKINNEYEANKRKVDEEYEKSNRTDADKTLHDNKIAQYKNERNKLIEKKNDELINKLNQSGGTKSKKGSKRNKRRNRKLRA